MLSGRRLNLLDPSPFDVEIEDIARGLARVARWNGQTHGNHAFSVAEHSVLVAQLFTQLYPTATTKERLAALLHDAAEYVIGDMISPFKAALGLNYKDFETRLEGAIFMRFGLNVHMPTHLKQRIKRCDRYCAYFEAIQIAGFCETEARQFFSSPPSDLNICITPKPVTEAQTLFLNTFETLTENKS